MVIKYLSAGICLLIALSQMVPIYNISSGLILGQGEGSSAYYIGKLSGHILVVIIVLLIASKLIKSVIDQKGVNDAEAK